MDGSRLAELRRWADRLAGRGDETVAAAGRTIRSLVDALEAGAEVDPARLARIGARAKEAASAPDTELRAAGRAVVLLVDELERRGRRPRLERRGLVVGAVAVGTMLVAGTGAAARHVLAPSLHVSGLSDGALLGRSALRRTVVVARGAGVRLRVDGRELPERGGRLAVASLGLGDGRHVLEVRSGPGFLGGRRTRRLTFTIDRTPPAIAFAGHRPIAKAWSPIVVRGSTDAVRLAIDGRAVPVSNGGFSLRLAPPVPPRLVVTAVDAAGNRASRRVAVSFVPRRPAVPIRAVHVTFYGWADRTLRAGVLRLIAEHRINAVELDLKDESGVAGFGPDVATVRRAGASKRIYDLRATVALLHAKGIRVIGRLVCFRDPLLASFAWRTGRRDWVVQTPAGKPYKGYGGFTNLANEDVRRYQISVAVAAARDGVDDVLYDYVRRPDGPIATMRFPGLVGTPEDAIVRFLVETRRALEPYGTYLGASVFGVAATRPQEVAQPIRRMAAAVDYVAPMVYPSHWADGEYGVADPNAEPYRIVRRSLADFERDVRGTGTRVVPWLQDFSLGLTYGAPQVRAQISAARADGIDEFLLWDPEVTYTADALTRDAKTSRRGLARPVRG